MSSVAIDQKNTDQRDTEIPSHHLPRLHRLLRARLPLVNEVSGYLPFVARFVWQTMGENGSQSTLRETQR